MKKKLFLLGIATCIALSACGKKATEDNINEGAVQETEDDGDKFSLGGIAVEVDAQTSAPKEEVTTEAAEVVEVMETFADGTSIEKLSNGDYSVGLNQPGKLAEQGNNVVEATNEAGETVLETAPADETKAVENNFEVNQNVKMSEETSVMYDVVVTFWAENPDLSEEYLEDMIGSEDRFPGLSDFERQNMIKEIKTAYPHNPEETKAYADYFNY